MFPARLFCALLWLLPAAAGAQGFADEDRDWGVPASVNLRRPPYTAPTPREIPGARVLRTLELKEMLEHDDRPLMIDVASGEGRITIAGSMRLSGAGRGANLLDPLQVELARSLETTTAGDRGRALVFFCVNSQCWLSYNAALRAAALGYSLVYWYRGGVEAWRAAGLPLERTRTEAPLR